MSRRFTTDLSLSLVDVVTNGLASILVLFFLLTLIRQQVTWESTFSEQRGHASQAIDPLLIVVTSTSDQELFTGQQSPWASEPSGPQIRKAHGRNFATFFAPDAPQSPQQVVLTLPPEHGRCKVQIVHGTVASPKTIEPNQVGPIVLWPPTERRSSEGAYAEESTP